MAATFKSRKRTFAGEENRRKAIARMLNEYNVSEKMKKFPSPPGYKPRPVHEDRPEQQRAAAEQLRARANQQRRVTSHGGAPKGLTPSKNGLAGVRLAGGGYFTDLAKRVSGNNGRHTGTLKKVAGQTPMAYGPRVGGGSGGFTRPGGPAGSFGRGKKDSGQYGAGLNQIAQQRAKALRESRSQMPMPRGFRGKRAPKRGSMWGGVRRAH